MAQVKAQEQKCKISIDKTELHPLVKLISRFADFSHSHCQKRRSDVQNLIFSGCRSELSYDEKDKQGHEISFQQRLAAREIRGFAPIGMMEQWNCGMMG